MRKRRRNRKRFASRLAWLWMGALVLTGVAVNVYLALRPAALEEHLREALGKYFAVPVEFSHLRVAWRLGVEIEGLRFLTPDGSRQNLIQVRKLRILPDPLQLLRGRFVARELILEEPVLYLERRADGSWNLEDLLPQDRPGSTSELELPRLSVVAGRLVYTDPFTFTEPLLEEVEDIYATVFRPSAEVAEFKAEMRSEGLRRLYLNGRIRREDTGPKVQLNFQVAKLDLASPFHRFFPPALASACEGL